MANFISEMSGGLKFVEEKNMQFWEVELCLLQHFFLKEQAESSKENWGMQTIFFKKPTDFGHSNS